MMNCILLDTEPTPQAALCSWEVIVVVVVVARGEVVIDNDKDDDPDNKS